MLLMASSFQLIHNYHPHIPTMIPIIKELWSSLEEGFRTTGRPDRIYAIDPDDCVLVVIDMQHAFCAEGGALEYQAARSIVTNINTIAECARHHQVPVVWLRQVYGPNCDNGGSLPLLHRGSRWGESRQPSLASLSAHSPEIAILSALNVNTSVDHVVDKTRYSPFTPGSSSLDSLLRTMKRKTLLLTGVATNVCCEVTAHDAMMLDYNVVCISDAMATNHQVFHEVSLMNIKMFYGDVITTNTLIADLER